MNLDEYTQLILDGCNHYWAVVGENRKCCRCGKKIPLCEHNFKPTYSKLIGHIEVCEKCNMVK